MADKITFQELVDEFSEKSGETKVFSNTFIKDVFMTIQEGLRKDENVNIKGLGIFKLQEVAERKIINPKTGKPTFIEAHKKIVYRPEKDLRERVNEKYANLEAKVIGKKEEKKEEPVKKAPAPLPPIVKKPLPKEPAPKKPISSSDEEPEKNIRIIYGDKNPPSKKDVKEENPLLTDNLSNEKKAIKKTAPVSSTNETKDSFDDSEPNAKPPIFIIEKKHKRSAWRWIFTLLLILLIIAVIYFVPSGSIKLNNFPFLKTSKNISLVEKKVVAPKKDSLKKEISALTSNLKEEQASPVTRENTVKVITTKNNIKTISQASEDEKSLIHIVKPGNTLWGLSNQYYKRYSLWPNIYRKNNEILSTPDFLSIGTELLIPELSGKSHELTKADSAKIAQGYYLVYTAYKKYNEDTANEYLKMAKKFKTTLE